MDLKQACNHIVYGVSCMREGGRREEGGGRICITTQNEKVEKKEREREREREKERGREGE